MNTLSRAILSILVGGLGAAAAVPSLAQDGTSSPQPAATAPATSDAASEPQRTASDYERDRMLMPPLVSGQIYPSALKFAERSNYLRAGFFFTTAYTDNALGSFDGHPVSDVSYSLAPLISLDQTTPRMHSEVTYAPGFTFYQQTSARNEADHNVELNFEYRLSPHVTFSALDTLQRSSNVFNQPIGFSGVSGGPQAPNFSVITPVAARLTNAANLGLGYQFALNGMVGVSGTFSNLHFPNPEQVPGLYDSDSQGGSAFYSTRLGGVHYVGAMYQYQRLMAYPTDGVSETQTQAFLMFYTVFPKPGLAISVFAGPQHADTLEPVSQSSTALPAEIKSWTPTAGGSVAWRQRTNAFAVSYAHTIAGGSGLVGAVHMDYASANFRRQLSRSLTASLNGSYVQNRVIGLAIDGVNNGHSLSASASFEKQLTERIGLQVGYTRLHQDYSGVSVLASAPDTNREFISLSYDFLRPIGR